MDAGYYLKVLGEPELFGPNGRPVKLKVRKHLALLIYMAVERRVSYRRDSLVEMLWSGVPAEKGRHSLSMGLSVLRGLFGAESVRGNHATVQFAPSQLSLDLDLLERGAILGDQVTPPLEVDGFLREFEIPDAGGFQHWRDRHHAYLLPLIQGGILALADHARRSGNMTRVMMLAERLLALDSLAEEGIRAKMEAYAMQGDRVAALRVYEEWRRDLNGQLGAVPSPLLENMAERLRRRGVERLPIPLGPSVQTEHWAERRFVGRAAEYRALFDAWESTTQLNTRHVLLTGETGIGKSTLAMRFGTAAALEGAAVARVQCFEMEQRIAFGMIGALVTSLLDRPGVVATAPESLAEVARVVPTVRERFPNLPRPRQIEGEAARLHFAEGTFALFDSILDDQPLILIVDDYPRSDEASLSVLHMLLRRAGTERLMVVLSGRPPEPDEPAQVTRIRRGVEYLPLQKVELRPFTEEESDELLGALLVPTGKQPGTPERRAILRASSGNPMALELLAQDWVSHGDAAIAVSLPAMVEEVPAAALEAAGYDRLLERLLPTLGSRTRAALHLAAVLGPQLNHLEHFALVDLTQPQVMAAMSELIACRVLRDAGAGLEFVNELVRARVYLKVPSATRRRLHAGVADRLLASAAAGETVKGLEIAWHCIRSGRRDEATPYLMSGARSAVLHGAPDEAVRALSSALGHLKGRAKDEAALLLAETYQEMGEWEASLACISQLVKIRDDVEPLKERAQSLELEGRQQLDQYHAEERPAIVHELISRLKRFRDPSSRVRSGLSAACLAGVLRQPELLGLVYDALELLPTDSLDSRDVSRVLLAQAMTSYHVRANERGLERVMRAASVLEASGITDSTFVHIQTGLGSFATLRGDYTEGVERSGIAFKAAARLDNMALMSRSAANLALSHYRLGAQSEHLKWATIALDTSKRLTVGSYDRVHAIALLGLAHGTAGRVANARQSLRILRQARHEASLAWVKQATLLYEADIAWLIGDEHLALQLVQELHEFADGPLAIGFVGRYARWSTVSMMRDRVCPVPPIALTEWYGKLERLDSIDRAELLCSLAWFDNRAGLLSTGVHAQARVALAKLPTHCSEQLRRLGLLLPD